MWHYTVPFYALFLSAVSSLLLAEETGANSHPIILEVPVSLGYNETAVDGNTDRTPNSPKCLKDLPEVPGEGTANKCFESESVADEEASDYIPFHYDVKLNVQLVPYTATTTAKHKPYLAFYPGEDHLGGVRIFLKRKNDLKQERSSIIIYANNRLVSIIQSSIEVRNNRGENILISDIKTNSSSNLIKIQLGKEFETESELEVYLAYILHSSPVTNSFDLLAPNGTAYYLSVFRQWNWNNHKSSLFPCLHDKFALSTFGLTVLTPAIANVSTISHTTLLAFEPLPEDPSWIQSKFETTPLMRPQSVSFIISNFEYVERVTSDGTAVRVHAPQYILDEFDRGSFSADGIVNIMDILGNYFNTAQNLSIGKHSFQVKKIDVVFIRNRLELMDEIGITSLIVPGSSWSGLRNYDDPLWGIPPYEGKSQEQKLIRELVRPIILQWYFPHTHLFIGRGLISLDKDLHLYQKPPLQFLLEYLEQTVLKSLSSRFLWNRTVEIERNFPGRHNRVLEMLEDGSVLGNDAIRRAVIDFRQEVDVQATARRRLLSNAECKDIFGDFLQSSVTGVVHLKLPKNVSASDLLDSWSGHNVAEVTCDTRCECRFKEKREFIVVNVDVVNDTHLSFAQNRVRGKGIDENLCHTSWYLPVTVQTDDGKTASFWLSDISTAVVVQVNHTASNWILVDPNVTAIHMTMYDPILLNKLRNQLLLNHTVFSPMSRGKLLVDYLSFISFLPYDDFNNESMFDKVSRQDILSLINYLDREDDIVVWGKIMDYFSAALNYGERQVFIRPPIPAVQTLMDFMRHKYRSILNKIDVTRFTSLPFDQLNIEGRVLLSACIDGSPICPEKVEELLEYWRKNPDIIRERSLHSENDEPFSLLNTVIVGGGKEAFDLVLTHFLGRGKVKLPYYNTKSILVRLPYSNDHDRLQGLLLNLTAPASYWNPKSKTTIRSFGNSLVILYYTNTQVGHVVRILNEERFAGMRPKLYRTFFYENCDRIAEFDDEMKPKDYFPRSYTMEQFEKLRLFLESKPECLRNHRSDKKLKAQVERILEEERKRVEVIEKWMEDGAGKFLSYFSDNKN